MIAGFIFAKAVTDNRQTLNPWYNRPDMKPYPAMVKTDPEEQKKIDTMLYAHSARYRQQLEREDFWRSPVIRYFFPRFAAAADRLLEVEDKMRENALDAATRDCSANLSLSFSSVVLQ